MREKLKFVSSYLHGYRKLYAYSVIAIIISTLFGFISPLLIRFAIDNVIGTETPKIKIFKSVLEYTEGNEYFRSNLWIIAVAIILTTAVSGFFGYLKGKWSATASESASKRLRDRLYNHIQRLPFAYHVKMETGDIIQRCTSDVETIRIFMSAQLVEIGRAIFMIILIIPVMLSLDKSMTMISMVVIPALFCFSYFFFLQVKKSFKESDEAEGAMSAVLQENLSGIRVVKAFHRQDYEIDKFDEKNSHYRDKNYRVIRLLAYYWAISDFLAIGQIFIVTIIGTLWAISGKISIGTLVAFITYEGNLLWPIRQMGRTLTDMGKTSVAIDRIKEILDRPEEETEGLTPGRFQGNIEFRDVSFGYDNDNVLKGINLKIKAGETIAILGATGSGKSTLVHLLPRLYEPGSGSILLDGEDIKDIDKHELRKQISIVLQEPFLYSRTIKNNIRMGSDNPEDEQIYETAEIACIHNSIKKFEDGYETLVGEKGVTLSGGQKQRVAIARALMKETPVIIFDDSLSAVDTETDSSIRQALKRRHGSATTIIIAHRLTTLAECDRIIVLEHGQITQAGTHAQLINEEGLYKRIWTIQNYLEKDIQKDIEKADNEEVKIIKPAS